MLLAFLKVTNMKTEMGQIITNKWEIAFFTLLGSFVIITILMFFSIFSFLTYEQHNNISKSLATYEDTYINIELLLNMLNDKQVRIKRGELIELYKQNENSENFRGNESSTIERYAFSIGHLRFEFDKDDYLTGLRADPNFVANIYKREFPNSFWGNYMFSIRQIKDNFWNIGTDKHSVFGLFIILMMFIGVVYLLIYELYSKNVRHIVFAIIILISVNIFSFVSLFWKVYDSKIRFEDALVNSSMLNADYFISSLDWSIIYPSLLFTIVSINVLFLLIAILRLKKILFQQ